MSLADQGLDLDRLRGGGKPVLARALAFIERCWRSDAVVALLDAAWADPRGHVLGLTGPPGAGKSTLASALVRRARGRAESVGVVAVDPSSRRSGGALLGDRTRISVDPDDPSVFVRSMAARDRLGGLSEHAFAAVALMRAVFDLVLVESVGVGQSETDIAHVADTAVLCVQPGSGDTLQFMKAGVMEMPDVFAITKGDLGAPAEKAGAEVRAALTLVEPGAWIPPVVVVTAAEDGTVADLESAIGEHRRTLAGTLPGRRAAQAEDWIRETIRAGFGEQGLKRVEARIGPIGARGPFAAERALALELSRLLQA